MHTETIQYRTSTLGQRIERHRLLKNTTQAALATAAGISERTLRRLESGEGGTIDTLVRVLSALKLDENLDSLVPDHSVRPIERARKTKTERKRASGSKTGSSGSAKPDRDTEWTWGDNQ